MLPIHFLNTRGENKGIPLTLYSIGWEHQVYMNRPVGFPVNQVFLTKKGTGVFRIFGLGELELKAGHVLVLPAGVAHEYFPLTKSPWQLGFIGFEGNSVNPILENIGLKQPKVMTVKSFSSLWSYVEKLWQIAKKNENDAVMNASVSLYSFLLELRKLEETNSESHINSAKHSPHENIRKIVNLLHEHYDEPLEIASLSSLAGFTPQHFTRIFRKMYGLTPYQYLNKIRFEKAIFLLKEEPEWHVHEIAERLGMETNYFIRAFKKKYGVTPGVYRGK